MRNTAGYVKTISLYYNQDEIPANDLCAPMLLILLISVKVQHILMNQAPNFTAYIIYIWDFVKIYIQFFLVEQQCTRVLITKATIYHVPEPVVSTYQYHSKITSAPSQVATSHKDSSSYNTSPSTAEVKNGWSYISTPPICLHNVDRENFLSFTFHIIFSIHYFSFPYMTQGMIQHLKSNLW